MYQRTTIKDNDLHKIGWALTWTMAGKRYAMVFPEPVSAMPIRSRPFIAIGHPWDWIGVGSTNPAFSISCRTYSDKGYIRNSGKVISIVT